jgi:hypothetical protein
MAMCFMAALMPPRLPGVKSHDAEARAGFTSVDGGPRLC